jgi:hypothetical protein
MAIACRVVCALVLTALLGPILAAPSVLGDYVVGWSDPFLMEDYDLHSATSPCCAMNDNGDIVVVWGQWIESQTDLYGRIYHAGVGWSEPEPLEHLTTVTRNPKVAIDSVGNAFVVWQQTNGSTSKDDLWSNHFVRGVGWSGPEPIEETGTENDYYPEILMTDKGDIVSVWTRQSVPARVMCSEYEDGAGWGVPYILDGGGGSIDAYRPCLGADSDGDICVVWIQYEVTTYSIWSKCRQHPNDYWDAAKMVADDTGHTAFAPPVLSIGDGGNAMSAWPNWNDTSLKWEVWTCAYEADVGWGAPGILSSTVYADDLNPAVAVDKDGNAIALFWRDGGWDDGIYMSTYDVDSGWDGLRMVANSDSGNVFFPKIAMNDDGAAKMVFLSDDGAFTQVRGAALNPTGGFYPSEQISVNTLGDASNAMVVIDKDGNALALWMQGDGGKYNIWGARYVAMDESPPSVTIDAPEDGATVNSSTVVVSGFTEPGAGLVVNSIVVEVQDDGSFECSVVLVEGENVITAVATDEAGNRASISITVIYVVPEGATEETLGDLRQELNETIADLDEANGRIDALSSLVMLLGAALALFAAISVITLLMHLRQRRGTGIPEQTAPEDKESPPSH